MEAVSYLRVSGKGQLDGDGFERQRDAIQRFAAGAGYTVVQEFREEGVSGTLELEDRPALLDVLTRIAANGVKVVLVERADRLARDLMVQEAIIRQLVSVGARVLTADGVDLTDDSDPTRTLLRQIMGAVAQWQKSVDVAKLRAARIRKRRTTGRCEGRKAFGSRNGEQRTQARIQALRIEGVTYAAIAECLTREGIRTRQGKPWSASYVQYVARKSREA